MPTTSPDQAERNLQVTLRSGRDNTREALHVIGLMIQNQVKVLLTGPPYSRPGQPPGLRTGGLRLSYTHDVRRSARGPYVAVFSDKQTLQPVPPHRQVVYAPYLEYGTSRMAARPHLRPAVNMVRPLIPSLIATSWRRGTGRTT